MKRYLILVVISVQIFVGLCSCEKFLSQRTDSSIANINSLKDLQALLDNGSRLNLGNYSPLIEVATDNFFISKLGFDRLSDFDKSAYTWKKDIYYDIDDESTHWFKPYQIISIANTVIDELPLVKETNGLSRNTIEGAARFHRAFAYMNLVQIYCKAYDPLNATNELGLPMRLSSDINLASKRATLEETYQIIENDILKAIELLPLNSEFATRPNKISAEALMARLYLTMERYQDALGYASSSLSKNNSMLDFSELDTSRPYPIEAMNKETLFFAYTSGSSVLNPTRDCFVDTVLLKSYSSGDLRKQVYFKEEGNGYHTFRGSFRGTGGSTIFLGLTVSEVQLILAECLARLGKHSEAIQTLNDLLQYRFAKDLYVPFSVSSSEQALEIILEERRKELIFRGVRWSDLKRLNRDPNFSRTLYREVEGYNEFYELLPDDSRYVFLIPQTIIAQSGIQQNDR